jgi:hypothetical protein
MAVRAVVDIGVKVVAAIVNSKVDRLPTDFEVGVTRAGAGEQNLAKPSSRTGANAHVVAHKGGNPLVFNAEGTTLAAAQRAGGDEPPLK